MVSAGRQFLLLLWKNYVLQKRKILLTILEIGIPLFLAIMLLAIRTTVISTRYSTPRTWNSFSVDNMTWATTDQNGVDYKLAYTPDKPITLNITDRITNRTGIKFQGETV